MKSYTLRPDIFTLNFNFTLSGEAVDIRSFFNAGIDYYVTNAHKWFASPRGAAFLCVKQGAPRDACSPVVVSHGAEKSFLGALLWDGCRDYAPILTVR